MENRTDQRVFWHGKLKKESRKTWQATALTALCSVALFCLLFSYKKMYPFGDGSVAITDLYSQYLPLLYHFYDVVTGQKNLFLDFSVSGGANLYADTINEVLNPFNYVLLLFGRDRIYQAVNVLVLLYSTASAVTAHIFLEKTASGRRFQNVALAGDFSAVLPGAFAFAAGEKGRLVRCFARMAADVVHSARVYDASVFTFCRGDLALYL